MAKARKFCNKIDLSKYVRNKAEQKLEQLLNKDTRRLVVMNLKWGTARKAINLFLRDATYNVYLRKAFKLNKIERYLELPLDSKVAKGLRKANKKMPIWKSIVTVTSKTNKEHQKSALELAKKSKTMRIHLDILSWPD